MKIKAAGSPQKTDSSRQVGASNAVAAAQTGGQSGVGEEFRSLMESFAGGVDTSSELSIDTFTVDELPQRATEVTQVQVSMQAAELQSEQQNPESRRQDSQRQSSEDRAEVEQVQAEGERHNDSKREVSNIENTKNGEEKGVESEVSQFKTLQESQESTTQVKAGEVTVEQEIDQVSSEEIIQPDAQVPVELKSSLDNTSQQINNKQQNVDNPVVKADAPKAEPELVAAVEKMVLGQGVREEFKAETKQQQQVTKNDVLNVAKGLDSSVEIAPKIDPTAMNLVGAASIQSSFQKLVSQVNKQDVSGINSIQSGKALSKDIMPAQVPVKQANAQQQNESKGAEKAQLRSLALKNLDRIQNALKEIARSHDGKTISFRLDPPELGTLKADVTLKAGTLHARLIAESSSVAQVLRDKAHELHSMLRKLGLNVDKVSVAVNYEGAPAQDNFSFLQNQQENAGNSNGSRGGSFEHSGNESIPVAVEIAGMATGKIQLDHWIA